MISIIICTISPSITSELEENIKSTIGISAYEIVPIYNINNKYSIFEAYNLGVNQSKYEICCFMHDDIIYHSKDWGSIVSEYFRENEKSGVIAVAGCKYLRKMPTFWSIPDYNVFNIIQSDRKSGIETNYWLQNSNVERIIAFDGMWFCIRKSLFEIIHFDESYYEGFHFYDLDIAMQIHNCQYQILAIPKIIIEHTSRGNIDNNWLINAFRFYDKWKLSLPISFVNNDKQIPPNIEDAAIISLLRMIRIERAYLLLIPWYRASKTVKGGFFNLVSLIVNFNIKLLRKKI